MSHVRLLFVVTISAHVRDACTEHLKRLKKKLLNICVLVLYVNQHLFVDKEQSPNEDQSIVHPG